MGDNDEYIDKSCSRVIQFFNNKCLRRYLRTYKLIFDNISEFKRYFTPLINNFDIKPVLTTIENLQANAPVEWAHQVILNILVTKDIDNKVFDCIDPLNENIA